ncbi:MAG: hypothetical protein WAV78_48835, partial [Xanthobacteraceae bacterium]
RERRLSLWSNATCASGIPALDIDSRLPDRYQSLSSRSGLDGHGSMKAGKEFAHLRTRFARDLVA